MQNPKGRWINWAHACASLAVHVLDAIECMLCVCVYASKLSLPIHVTVCLFVYLYRVRAFQNRAPFEMYKITMPINDTLHIFIYWAANRRYPTITQLWDVVKWFRSLVSQCCPPITFAWSVQHHHDYEKTHSEKMKSKAAKQTASKRDTGQKQTIFNHPTIKFLGSLRLHSFSIFNLVSQLFASNKWGKTWRDSNYNFCIYLLTLLIHYVCKAKFNAHNVNIFMNKFIDI